MRSIIEFFVCLLIAVTIFRSFAAEGYVIESGSMGPGLLGHFKRFTCPACGHVGEVAVEQAPGPRRARCGNCGQAGIAVEDLLRNEGDQLLVHRRLFEFRPPCRWEVVVFRNPNQLTEAYVKRVAGLPGETIWIQQGDIYINGHLQAKGLSAQRGSRVLVYDNDFRPAPDDADWEPRWVAENTTSGWQSQGGDFVLDSGRGAAAKGFQPVAWVNYRHWIRAGGSHGTSVRVDEWPAGIELPPTEPTAPLRWDAEDRSLICRGALSAAERDRWLKVAPAGPVGDSFRQSITKLYRASHIAPITDECTYNRPDGIISENPVRDLMLAMEVSFVSGAGQFVIEMNDGIETAHCILDLEAREARLLAGSDVTPVRKASLPSHVRAGGSAVLVEVSQMDRHVLLAIDGKVVFEPWTYGVDGGQWMVERGQRPEVRSQRSVLSTQYSALSTHSPPIPRRPVRFGARNVNVRVSHLKLFRDVYYTHEPNQLACDQPFQLGADEYFVLGDNSQVSRDSRGWPADRMLTGRLLLGKPFVVHLPSRRERIAIGGRQTEVRIPEISRIRYIR
ncbi:MAG: signal peptidase I [Planctomycetales bacterium]|nr:signal peptidase I [Planctomycetales bacterium]